MIQASTPLPGPVLPRRFERARLVLDREGRLAFRIPGEPYPTPMDAVARIVAGGETADALRRERLSQARPTEGPSASLGAGGGAP